MVKSPDPQRIVDPRLLVGSRDYHNEKSPWREIFCCFAVNATFLLSIVCFALNFIKQELVENFHFFPVSFGVQEPERCGYGGEQRVSVLRSKTAAGYS